MQMNTPEHVICANKDEIRDIERKLDTNLAELQAKSEYREKTVNELNDNMKEIKQSLDLLDKKISEFILKSINDDSELKEYINKEDNRITAIESRNKTLNWIIGIGFTAVSVLISGLAFLISNID